MKSSLKIRREKALKLFFGDDNAKISSQLIRLYVDSYRPLESSLVPILILF